ncbi:MAG: recombinase RecT [Burkholderiales bacterium]
MNAPASAAAVAAPTPPSLIQRFAARFGVEPNKMLTTLKSTAFRQKPGEPEVTNEQLMALLVVAEQYGLNPWTKEIYAFPDKGGIVPVVGVDGWARILNDHQAFNGVEFVDAESADGAPPAWIECAIFRKDREHPTRVREYMAECKRGTGPWGSHPRRMLRHKALMQCARIAFGYVGIYDEDEASRIIDGGTQVLMLESAAVNDINAAVSGKIAPAEIEDKAGNELPAMLEHATGEVVEVIAPPAAKPAKGRTASPTYAEVRAALDRSMSADAVQDAESLIDGLPEQFRAELHELAKTRRACVDYPRRASTETTGTGS